MKYEEIKEHKPPTEKDEYTTHLNFALKRKSTDRQILRRKILSNLSLKSKMVQMDEQKLLMNKWI